MSSTGSKSRARSPFCSTVLNPVAAIMRYGRLTLTNPAGLLTVFDFSRPDAMDAFVTSLRGMAA